MNSGDNDLLPLQTVTFSKTKTTEKGRRRVLASVSLNSSEKQQTRIEFKAFQNQLQVLERQKHEKMSQKRRIELPMNVFTFVDCSQKDIIIYSPMIPKAVRFNPIVLKYRMSHGLFLGKIISNGISTLWIDRFDPGISCGNELIPTIETENDVLLRDIDFDQPCNLLDIMEIEFKKVPKSKLALDCVKYFYSVESNSLAVIVPNQTLRLVPLLAFSWSFDLQDTKSFNFGFIAIDSKRHVSILNFHDELVPVIGIWFNGEVVDDNLLYSLCWYYKNCSVEKFDFDNGRCLALDCSNGQFFDMVWMEKEDPIDIYSCLTNSIEPVEFVAIEKKADYALKMNQVFGLKLSFEEPIEVHEESLEEEMQVIPVISVKEYTEKDDEQYNQLIELFNSRIQRLQRLQMLQVPFDDSNLDIF